VNQEEGEMPPTEVEKIIDKVFSVAPLYFDRKLGKNK
jgi:hypothetical protein